MQKVKNLLHRNKDETDNVNHNNLNNTNTTGVHHNPLDRNHDGRVNVNDLTHGNQQQNILVAPGTTQTTTQTTTLTQEQTLLNQNRRLSQGYVEPIQTQNLSQGSYTATNISSGQYSNVAGDRLSVTRAEPTIVETIQKDVVIQERIHPVEKEEIQPIIYREREQLDVKQVTQMMHETQIQPTIVQQRELAAEIRAPIVERGAPIQENVILPSTQRDATLRTQQVHAPIIEETIKKTVIQEIQPVLERDVFVPTVVQNTQPIYEKIVEAPTVYREVREVQELGTRNVEYTQPIITQPTIIREVPVVAPVVVAPVVQQPIVEHVTMSTTTTTTDSFMPAKILNEGELRNFQPAASNVAPNNTRRV